MTATAGPRAGTARRRPFHWPATAFALALAAAAPAAADAPGGTFNLQVENDRIADTDRHYTHGTRLSWVSNERTGGPAWVRDLMQTLYPTADATNRRIGFAIGQNIYTPENTDARTLLRDDRPYAGWLYGAVSLHVESTRRLGALELATLDSVEISLGVVGPQSYAADAQNTVHDIIGVSRSRGWHNQLKNEPALAILFERKWRPKAMRRDGFEVDVIPHAGGSLGNVFVLANAGGTLRFGRGLELDYGPPHIRPTLSGLEAVGDGDRFGWYVFAGAEARAVLRNIFLDGNTFAASHSVDKKTMVGDFQVGAAVIVRGLRIAFTHVFRTREFDGQPGGDRYGTFSVSYRF